MKDGSFIYQNKEISFKISDNNTPVVIRGDLEKMTRFITFYYGINNLGTYSIYGEVEELTNISPQYAEKKFKELKLDKKFNNIIY